MAKNVFFVFFVSTVFPLRWSLSNKLFLCKIVFIKIYNVPCSLCHNKLIDWSHLNWAIPERNQTYWWKRWRGGEGELKEKFLEKPLGFLYFISWEVSGKTKLYPCVRHLENPKAKYQNIYPWKFHIIFLVTPAGSLVFFMPFFQYPWIGISISLTPPSLVWVFTEIAH